MKKLAIVSLVLLFGLTGRTFAVSACDVSKMSPEVYMDCVVVEGAGDEWDAGAPSAVSETAPLQPVAVADDARKVAESR
jgi:hypothetical protein